MALTIFSSINFLLPYCNQIPMYVGFNLYFMQ
jgi:hypothetical protein